MTRRASGVRATGVAVAVLLSVWSAGCGSSPADKATEQVCSVSTDVAGRLDKLDAVHAGDLDPVGVQGELASLAVRLKQLRDALPDLGAAKARQLQAAEARFQEQFGTVLQGLLLGQGVGAKGIQADLERGLTALSDSYRGTVARVTARWCP